MYGQNKSDREVESGSLGPIFDLTADTTLTVASYPSGSIIRFTPPSGAGALDITLPAHEEGVVYHIYQTSAYDTAVCNVLSADGNDWEGSISSAAGTSDVAAGTDDKVIFGSATIAGDKISIISHKSKWFVFEATSCVTTNGILFG